MCWYVVSVLFNGSLHWTLIVICHPGEVPRYKGKISVKGPMHMDSTLDFPSFTCLCHVSVEDSGKSVKVPCILHLDSLKGSHTGLKNHVQRYLLLKFVLFIFSDGFFFWRIQVLWSLFFTTFFFITYCSCISYSKLRGE